MASCEWIINEVKEANFGDKRLDKRYESILNGLFSSPNASIPSTFQSWKETLAAYRFLNHAKVNPDSILLPHSEATLERIKAEKIVLIPQDTTEIDFTGRKSLSGIGYLSSEKGQGLYLHPSIAFTPKRVCFACRKTARIIRRTKEQDGSLRRDIGI